MNELEKAFLAGFRTSGEGFNGEYPYEGHSNDFVWSEIKEYYKEFLNNNL